MMKTSIDDWFKSFNRQQMTFDVEDELQFHIEMLERKYVQDGMSATAAKAAALRRFGSLERAMKQCVAIRSRNSLRRRVLKTSLILLGLTGFLIRLLSSDRNVDHIGDILIMIAISARLLLYVRGLNPSTFLSGTNETCPSIVTVAQPLKKWAKLAQRLKPLSRARGSSSSVSRTTAALSSRNAKRMHPSPSQAARR